MTLVLTLKTFDNTDVDMGTEVTPSPLSTLTPELTPTATPYPEPIATQIQTPAPDPTSTPIQTPTTTQTPEPSPEAPPSPIPTPPPTPVSTIAVGIYLDHACVNEASSLSWGTLTPGKTAQNVVFLRNEGNTGTVLAKIVSDFNPMSLSNYLSLSWDYDNQPVASGNVIKVKLYLSVAPETPPNTDFGFSITITAT